MDDVDMVVGRERGEIKRAKMLEFIKKYYLKHGYGPSYREIGKATGQSSVSPVKYHLNVMRANGDIKFDYKVARSIVPTDAVTVMATDNLST